MPDKKRVLTNKLLLVPAAPPPSPTAVWPLPYGRTLVPRTHYHESRAFGARRAWRPILGYTRTHCAVDLYAEPDDPVVAVDYGKILAFYPFYKIRRGEYAYALIIRHKGWVANYGEVDADSLELLGHDIGDTVIPGQQIGWVKKLKKSSMLHFETYVPGVERNIRWRGFDTPPPDELRNPTELLLTLAARHRAALHEEKCPHAN